MREGRKGRRRGREGGEEGERSRSNGGERRPPCTGFLKLLRATIH
jgi:hypothetical protein